MASATGLDLRWLGELEAVRDVLHDRVAAGAPDIPRVVGAAVPEHAGALLMAGETHRVLCPDRRGVLLRERALREHDQRALHGVLGGVDVRFPGAVTALARVALELVTWLSEEEAAHCRCRETDER